MKWKFDNDKPIYLQIVEILKADIIAKKYEVGQKFPSVRDLAQIAGVNPNTMQKALVQLEQEGLLITNRASGRVVTHDGMQITRERESVASQKVNTFLTEMDGLGYGLEEVITLVETEGKEHGISGN
ncbi:MAG: GntR family transcriptional regulator [Eubacteriales bacterium]